MASASSKDKTRKQRHATAKAIANLRPQNTRSKDEQKEIARMGGSLLARRGAKEKASRNSAPIFFCTRIISNSRKEKQ